VASRLATKCPPCLRNAAAATSMAFTEFPRQLFGGVGQPKAALGVDFVPLGTPPGGRIKAFVMADVSQHLRVQAKLKERANAQTAAK
jgi:hypothetical protein